MPAAVMDALASAAGTQTGHWQKNWQEEMNVRMQTERGARRQSATATVKVRISIVLIFKAVLILGVRVFI